MAKKVTSPRILFLDIETAPIELLGWGLHNQFFSPSQIRKDRSVLSVAIAWNDDERVLFKSTAGQKDLRDDKAVVAFARDALNAADILVTQNGRRFDEPILKGRMAFHKMGPPSPYRHIDTKLMAKKLGFPSNKQEYLTAKLAPEFVKSKHGKFPGVDLWIEYLAGNKEAQREMAEYNKQDVRGLRGIFKAMQPFGIGVNLGVYTKNNKQVCPHCGSTHLTREGYAYTDTAKFQIFHCKDCGAWPRGKENLLSIEKRASLKKGA